MKMLARLLLAGWAVSLAAAAHAESPAAKAVAVLDFDYIDTSGEPSDQSAAHAVRLHRFMDALRSDLGKNGKFRIVALSCGSEPCSVQGTGAEGLFDQARKAGAKLLVFGGIHKSSSLVEWGKVQAVDVENNTSVLDKLITFRGDTDEAWDRAEKFVAGELLRNLGG
jgi:hypothetical protein